MRRGRTQYDDSQTAAEAFASLTLEHLRPLAELVAADPPTRKSELAPLMARIMTDPSRVRKLYDGLDEMAQNAVRVAAFDPAGRLDGPKFRARFGSLPRFDTADPSRRSSSYSYAEQRKIKPTALRLFFPKYDRLPTDIRDILREFVSPPEAFAIPTADAPPETVTLTAHTWDGGQRQRVEFQEAVRVRETAREAEADVRAVLRLIDAGKVRVTDKKRVPTETTRQALTGILAGGDFYGPDDAAEYDTDPSSDPSIKAFAWPVLVQAGGLAEKSGDALALTAAGKRALSAPPPDALRKLWAAWKKTGLLDEFSRVEAIKGQGRAQMSAVAGRRQVVIDALGDCPVGRWFSVEDFFRLLRATGRDFAVAYSVHELYIAEHYYGNLGYDDAHAWEQLQGRFVLAFLFEYAATLGLVDVGYIPPAGARSDFRDRWGADDLSCLSRYDGLTYLRINPLGAWILGRSDEYRPAEPERVERLRVLANRDVVAPGPLPAADRLLLDRFADSTSDGVWKLSAERVLEVVEHGGSIHELEQFLGAKAVGEVPPTVVAFLDDLRRRSGRLADAGPAHLIECADEHVVAELTSDPQLRSKCLPAGDRFVVVRRADLATVRKAVRRLGYVWPAGVE